MSSFAPCLTGMVVVIGGLACGAYLLHAPGQWIGVGAVTHTRRRDPPES